MPTFLEFDGETGHVWAHHSRPRGAPAPTPGAGRGIIEHPTYSRDLYVDVAAPGGPVVVVDAAGAALRREAMQSQEP